MIINFVFKQLLSGMNGRKSMRLLYYHFYTRFMAFQSFLRHAIRRNSLVLDVLSLNIDNFTVASYRLWYKQT